MRNFTIALVDFFGVFAIFLENYLVFVLIFLHGYDILIVVIKYFSKIFSEKYTIVYIFALLIP